jgi:hypothetical protein
MGGSVAMIPGSSVTAAPLVIVDQFNVLGPIVPAKADAELVVDPDRILCGPIPDQNLEAYL